MKLDFHELFRTELVDLGARGEESMVGVMAPAPEVDNENGVTKQFLRDPHVYHRKFTNHKHFERLIRRALDCVDMVGQPDVILDIGSG